MMMWVLVFFVTLLVDWAWTKYTLETANKNALDAAFWSMVIIGLGGLNVIAYTHDKWLLIPAALGAFTGTYLAVKKESNENQARGD